MFLIISCFMIYHTSNLFISSSCRDSVYEIILQYLRCANVISVCHLESMNQPEKCTVNTSRRLGQVGTVFGDNKSTHLTSPEEARSLNSLPLPLQVAEVEQYLLDKIYFKIYMKSEYEKRVTYQYST